MASVAPARLVTLEEILDGEAAEGERVRAPGMVRGRFEVEQENGRRLEVDWRRVQGQAEGFLEGQIVYVLGTVRWKGEVAFLEADLVSSAGTLALGAFRRALAQRRAYEDARSWR